MGVDASPAHAGQLLTTYAAGRAPTRLPRPAGCTPDRAVCPPPRHPHTAGHRSRHPGRSTRPPHRRARQLTTNPATPNELLITMADRLPLASHNLAEWAAELTG